MLNFMHICHSFEISRIIHLHETSTCGTDSMSRPSNFIGFVMNLRTGRGKSALGAQNLALRDHIGDKILVVTEGEKDCAGDTHGQWWKACSRG